MCRRHLCCQPFCNRHGYEVTTHYTLNVHDVSHRSVVSEYSWEKSLSQRLIWKICWVAEMAGWSPLLGGGGSLPSEGFLSSAHSVASLGVSLFTGHLSPFPDAARCTQTRSMHDVNPTLMAFTCGSVKHSISVIGASGSHCRFKVNGIESYRTASETAHHLYQAARKKK